jgi:hypothetical protein
MSRKDWSDLLVWPESGPELYVRKERLASSAMGLHWPGQCRTDGIFDSVVRARIDAARTSLVAVTESACTMSLVAHTVADILSEKISECKCRSFIKDSRAICCMSIAAISKSLMVKTPSANNCWISAGNSTRQTVGGNKCDTQNPPIPSFDASSIPTADEVNVTSSRTWVGRRSKSSIMSCMSRMAPYRSNCCFRIFVALGWWCKALKKGVMRPLAEGAMRVALISLPVSFSRRCLLMRGCHWSFRNSAQIGSRFAVGNFHVRALPLSSKPRISLRVMSLASPFSSFFNKDIGSFPPV